jgi:hypothetical protein
MHKLFSDPIVGKNFFGREEILSLLERRCRALKDGYRQNIAILSQPLLGKTSLILHFLLSFREEKITPVYLDCSVESFAQFAKKFSVSLLCAYLKKMSADLENDLDFLKSKARPLLPETIAVIERMERLLKKNKNDDAFSEVFNLLSVFQKESKQRTLVIFDEFHHFENYALKSPFLKLGKEIMLQKNTLYIVLSSQVNRAKEILTNELALLFGQFEVIELETFLFTASCQFLKERLSGYESEPMLLEFLSHLTDGHPFYLDALSQELHSQLKERRQSLLTRDIVAAVLYRLIYEAQGILHQYLNSLVEANLNGYSHSGYFTVLAKMAEKKHRMKDLVASLNGLAKSAPKYIRRLAEADLIGRYGSFYKIEDRILTFWLAKVWQHKYSPFMDQREEKKEFFVAVYRAMNDFMQNLAKPMTVRLRELFSRFDNEMIRLDEKDFRLPKFKQVSSWAGAGIICQKESKYWLCWLMEKYLSETALLRFLETAGKTELPWQRIIIITLDAVEDSARLLAKEKKIWLWDGKIINLLFDLYGEQPLMAKRAICVSE